MKSCPVCGKPVEQEWAVCPYCGSPLGENAAGPRYAQSPGTGTQGEETTGPRYAPPPGAGAQGEAYTGPQGGPAHGAAPTGWEAEPPALGRMRQMICSPLYLAGAIGHTCMVLFTLASTFRTGAAALTDTVLAQLLDNVYWSSTWLDGLYNWMPLLFVGSVGSTLVGQLPNILVVVGLWMLYASAADTSGAPLKTAGLSIIRGVQIFQLVMLFLVALLMLVAFGVMVVGFQFYDLAAIIPIVLVFLVVLAVVLAVGGLYFGKLIATINGFRQTIWTGQPQGTVSLYVAVLAAVGGVLPLFRVLIGEIFASLASIGGATAGIAFAILLFRCHDEREQQPSAPPEIQS